MRLKSIISWTVSLALVGGGLALMAVFFVGQGGSEEPATNESDPDGFNVPEVASTEDDASDSGDDEGPEDKTLSITVPGMERIEDATVPSTAGNDMEALRENAAIHLDGTGFPWQEEANVYVAGHRLGYPGTDSFLAFYDQDALEDGDEIIATDSEGTEYVYEVFDNFVVGPTQVEVTEPMEGRNILTLQTCTLPDYSERIITQAELVETNPA